MPSFSSCSAARMHSHVDASLMSTRSAPTPAAAYREMMRRARATEASVSKDSRASTSVDT
jgi:hypothetical protein